MSHYWEIQGFMALPLEKHNSLLGSCALTTKHITALTYLVFIQSCEIVDPIETKDTCHTIIREFL